MSTLSQDLHQKSSSRCQHSTVEKFRQSLKKRLFIAEATVKPTQIVDPKRSDRTFKDNQVAQKFKIAK